MRAIVSAPTTKVAPGNSSALSAKWGARVSHTHWPGENCRSRWRISRKSNGGLSTLVIEISNADLMPQHRTGHFGHLLMPLVQRIEGSGKHGQRGRGLACLRRSPPLAFARLANPAARATLTWAVSSGSAAESGTVSRSVTPQASAIRLSTSADTTASSSPRLRRPFSNSIDAVAVVVAV